MAKKSPKTKQSKDQQQSHQKGGHLTLDDRIIIESGLNEDLSINKIAKKLDLNPSTVSREIARNSTIKEGRLPKCDKIRHCSVKHLCNARCTLNCKDCKHIDCTTRCVHHNTPTGDCPNKHIVCNSYKSRNNSTCISNKKIYSAKTADKIASLRNTSSREGFNLTGEQFTRIDEIATYY